MINLDSFGKIFILLGIIFLIIGGVVLVLKNVPFLGKLPGDIVIEKKNFTFYFPISTSILISIILSIILYLFTKK